MNTIETIGYKNCTINVHIDECPENPFTSWDCEPPLLTFYNRSAKAYNGAPENWWDILRLLPDSCFQRGKRVEFVRQFLPDYTLKQWAEDRANMGDTEAIAYALVEAYEEKPDGWRVACEWMETACAILNWGGITAVHDQSTGYSQGDVTLCLAIATPAWVERVGAPSDSLKQQLESAIELYGAWAWGDVYGYTVTEENGDEIDDASCWGFYGSDHDKSGLLENAQNAIDCHLKAQAKEARELEEAFTCE